MTDIPLSSSSILCATEEIQANHDAFIEFLADPKVTYASGFWIYTQEDIHNAKLPELLHCVFHNEEMRSRAIKEILRRYEDQYDDWIRSRASEIMEDE